MGLLSDLYGSDAEAGETVVFAGSGALPPVTETPDWMRQALAACPPHHHIQSCDRHIEPDGDGYRISYTVHYAPD